MNAPLLAQLEGETCPSLVQMEAELRDGRTPWNYRRRARAEVCRRGHRLSGENVQHRRDGRRECRKCIRLRNTVPGRRVVAYRQDLVERERDRLLRRIRPRINRLRRQRWQEERREVRRIYRAFRQQPKVTFVEAWGDGTDSWQDPTADEAIERLELSHAC